MNNDLELRVEFEGKGSFKSEPMTDCELSMIKVRAEEQPDMQLRTDIFRLLKEIKRRDNLLRR
jgi:hypothetical protein